MVVTGVHVASEMSLETEWGTQGEEQRKMDDVGTAASCSAMWEPEDGGVMVSLVEDQFRRSLPLPSSPA